MSKTKGAFVDDLLRRHLSEKRLQLQRLRRLQQLQRVAAWNNARPGWRLCLLLVSACALAGGIGGLALLILAGGLSAGVLLVRITCSVPEDSIDYASRDNLRIQQLQREIVELEQK